MFCTSDILCKFAVPWKIFMHKTLSINWRCIAFRPCKCGWGPSTSSSCGRKWEKVGERGPDKQVA